MSIFNKKIIIKKVNTVSGGAEAMSKEEYIPGTCNNITENKSIPVEYEIEGELINPIEVGRSIKVLRTNRNGVEALGWFTTSKLTEVTDNTFKTLNSVYTYKFI